MAGPAPKELELQNTAAERAAPVGSIPIVTTAGQHAEAVEKITGHVQQAGFPAVTKEDVAPQAGADQVLAEIKKRMPEANLIGNVLERIGREAEGLTAPFTGADFKYSGEPNQGAHLIPVQRAAQKSRFGFGIGAITNHFFNFWGKKKKA